MMFSNLKIGDVVNYTGKLFTARDRAHVWLLGGKELPFSLENGVIYHCGPIVKKEGDEWKLISAGPTTSMRISKYEPKVIEKFKIKAVIGKGGMDSNTRDAMKKHGCVYLSAVGGAGALLAKCVKKVCNVYMLEEFGAPEALWELEVENFPTIVTMDANGNSLHDNIRAFSRMNYDKLI